MQLRLFFSVGVVSLIGLALLVERVGSTDGQLGKANVASSASGAASLGSAQGTAQELMLPPISASSAPATITGSVSSANKSSLSYPRVDPSEQIKHFLNAMDETAVPKVATREVKREALFDYAKATPEELKARALNGDPYAALDYANYVRLHSLWVKNERDIYEYNPDRRLRMAALQEMREFYVRAMSGGLRSAATMLSLEYSRLDIYQVESLAWRKIAFAMGESERFDCLRDSTTCYVKDFNNLNMDEFFYPCVRRAQDQCNKTAYEDATLLALQYLNSFDLAVKGPQTTTATLK